MSAGFVYVMVNPALTVIKVGCSTKIPHYRAEELSRDTGVPAPYEVVYYAHFDQMFIAEQEAHRRLGQWAYNKEFFNCTPQNAIQIIEKMGGVRCFMSSDLELEPSVGTEYVYKSCSSCNKTNRIPKDKKGGKCGACHFPLEPVYEYMICPTCKKTNRFPVGVKGRKCGACKFPF